MKRSCIFIFVIFFSLALVNTPTRAKAATLTENETIRLGIAGIGYGLEHFGYVLPSPNQIEALGGFSEYAKIVGQRISEADPFDDWYADNEILTELFAPITFARDLGYIIASLFSEEGFYSLFGFDVSPSIPSDIDGLQTQINTFNQSYNGTRNYVIWFGDGVSSGSYRKSFLTQSNSIEQVSIHLPCITFSSSVDKSRVYGSSVSSALPYVICDSLHPLYVLYWGQKPFFRNRMNSEFYDLPYNVDYNVILVDMVNGSGDDSFEPSLSPYSGSYEIDIGDSYYYPSVFYNNYGTIYNNLQADNFYDAVNLIINDPDNPGSEDPPSIKPIGPPSGPSLGGVDFDLGQPLFVKPYLQRFFSESYDFVVFVHDSIWASGIDYVFYAILICGIMGGIISKILH